MELYQYVRLLKGRYTGGYGVIVTKGGNGKSLFIPRINAGVRPRDISRDSYQEVSDWDYSKLLTELYDLTYYDFWNGVEVSRTKDAITVKGIPVSRLVISENAIDFFKKVAFNVAKRVYVLPIDGDNNKVSITYENEKVILGKYVKSDKVGIQKTE